MDESRSDRVRFNVGGKRFETTKSTLDQAGPDSYFSCLQRWNSNDSTGGKTDEIFIDRDPHYFGILLHMLRTGDLQLNRNINVDFLCKEARFYGLEDKFRAAVRGDLDGERMRLARAMSVPYCMPEPTMIRASPTGALCIAGVNTLCSYDEWKIEEDHQNPLIHTDSPIYDVLWRDSWDIVVSTKKHIGIFNTASGELRHWFSGHSQSGFYSSKLCMSSNSNDIFSSCTVESTGMVSEITLWDAETGQLKRRLSKAKGGVAKKLQWISGINCLLAIYCCNDRLELKYLDVRLGKKELVCHIRTRPSVVDAATDESENTSVFIEKIGERTHVWLFDNRKIFTRTESKLDSSSWVHNSEIESVYCHQGQLFGLSKSEVLVLSGNRWVSTKIEVGKSDSINDISIAGNRLFSLHSNPKVVRVWESPRHL